MRWKPLVTVTHVFLANLILVGISQGASLLYWNIYGNNGSLPRSAGVAGRLEYILPEEGVGGGGEAAGSTQKLFYLKDHLGSTRAVMNTNGAVVESYDYYPFGLKMPGRIYPATPTVTKNLFTGKELDGETGWYYFGARPYLAHLGRWPVVDPLWHKYPSLSPYNYAANNPVVVYDPDGRFLDTILDVAFIAYDIYDIASTAISGGEVSGTQWAALGADVAGAIIPGATGGGAAVRAASKADEVVDIVKGTEKVADVQKTGGRLGGAEHRTKVAEVAEQLKSEGWDITGGGGKAKEEYLPGPGGSKKGSNYVDLTATKEGKTKRVQVGKQTTSGQPVSREKKKMEEIQKKKSNDELEFVPYNKKKKD